MKVNNKIILSVVIAVAVIGVASWIFLSVNKNQTSNLPTGGNDQQATETKLQEPDQNELAKAEEAIKNFGQRERRFGGDSPNKSNTK